MADDIVTLDPFKRIIDFNFVIRLFLTAVFGASSVGIVAGGSVAVSVEDATLDFESITFTPETIEFLSKLNISQEYILRNLPVSTSSVKPGSVLATPDVGSFVASFEVNISGTVGATKGYMLDDVVRTRIDLGGGREAIRIDFNIKYFDNS